MKYFKIFNIDGDTIITSCYSKADLLSSLDNPNECMKDGEFDSNTQYWSEKCLIIKGEIVVPHEVSKIIEMDIE